MMRFHTDGNTSEALSNGSTVEIWTTAHPHKVCGFFTVNGNNNHEGRFSGQIEVFSKDENHHEGNGSANGKPAFTRIGLIETNDYATQVTALQTKGHDRIRENLPGLRMSRDELKSADGEQNAAYKLARTIAENTERSTDEVKGWIRQFDAELRSRHKPQESTGAGWTPYSHTF